MEQGRLASNHMFGKNSVCGDHYLPYGIYTIPEISMVGQTEQELTEKKIPYDVVIARYEELAKAQMLGDADGLLKLLFHPETLKVLGVHAIGERAAEIIHIGQAVLGLTLKLCDTHAIRGKDKRIGVVGGVVGEQAQLVGADLDLVGHGEGARPGRQSGAADRLCAAAGPEPVDV